MSEVWNPTKEELKELEFDIKQERIREYAQEYESVSEEEEWRLEQ